MKQIRPRIKDLNGQFRQLKAHHRMKNLLNLFYPLLIFTLASISAAKEDPPVIAVADFNTPLKTYASQESARNLAAQVQASLARIESVRLVERSQLEVAAKELALAPYLGASARESLAIGRWLGADLIMLGTLDKSAEGAWNLWIEVVDTVDADVLADASIPLTMSKAPELDPQLFLPIGERLIKEALEAKVRNSRATLVISPLFFEFIGRLRNLEPLNEEFFRELQSQSAAGDKVRLLHFPRAEQVQHEMELRLDGLTETTLKRPSRNPVFFWGDLEEVDAEGKPPEEVMLRAKVNLRANHGQTKEIVLSATVARAPELIKQLVREVLDQARQLSQAPTTAAKPNTAEAEKLLSNAKKLREEFMIRKRSGEPIEAQLRLGRHINSLYQLAIFFSPENASLQREYIMARNHLLSPYSELYFTLYFESNNRWKRFEARFPGQHNAQSLDHALRMSLVLLHQNIREIPRDWPPDLWEN